MWNAFAASLPGRSKVFWRLPPAAWPATLNPTMARIHTRQHDAPTVVAPPGEPDEPPAVDRRLAPACSTDPLVYLLRHVALRSEGVACIMSS